MKKRYTTYKHKSYHKAHSAKVHHKRLKRKGMLPDPERRKRYQSKIKAMKERAEFLQNKIELKFPSKFSIVHNPEEVLSFFDAFQDLIEQGKPVDLRMEDVIEITPDAILYLISIFKENRMLGKPYKVQGNAPYDETARDLFIKSGFYRYVSSSVGNKEEDTRVFTIREGHNCAPKTAKNVMQYVRKHLGISGPTKETRNVFSILIEVMTNTANHAVKKGEQPTWYLMAQHKDNEVYFAFLDSGLGIPHTLQRNFRDIFAKMRSVGRTTDHLLIQAALDGEFRTQTGEKKRGKGLPKIKQIAKDGTVKDSIIVSNLGYVNCSNGINKRLNTRFHGSLLSWKIAKGA